MTASDHLLLHEHEPPFRLSLPRRLLLQTAAASPEPSVLALDSDVVLILASLLCALICVVGLALAARCTWLRSAVAVGTVSAPPPNKGLKKKAIRALPKLSFSPAHRAALPFSDCPICLADFAEGDEVRVLPRCAHAFHAPCIDTWLASHSSCPSCRQNLAASANSSKGAAAAATAAAAAEQPGVGSAAASATCAAPAGPLSGGGGRCLWCGSASSVADADGREQGYKGREDSDGIEYQP